MASTGIIMKKPAQELSRSGGRVVPQGVRIDATECRAVVAGGRNVCVENLRQSVRPRVGYSGSAIWLDHRDGRKNQYCARQNKHGQHGHLDVISFDLLAEVLRSSPNHQTGNENRQHDENKNAVKSRTDSPENNFTEHDIDQRNHSTQRRERVMHAIHGATTGVGRDRSKQCGVRDAKPHFLAFHVSAGVQRRCMLVGPGKKRITSCFRPIGGGHAGKKQNRHGRPHRPAVPLRPGHPAKCVSQPGRNREISTISKKFDSGVGFSKG